MKNSFYALAFRMKYINRWGLMRSSRYETLSEHSFDTAFLAHALALIGNAEFGKSYDTDRVATLALYHDMSEVYTGDMPTPVKYSDGDMKKVYKKLEKFACDKILSKLPESLRPSYETIICPGEEDAESMLLVKAADKLSALLKCIEEIHHGNPEFKTAYDSTLKAIEKMNLPELNYFIEKFIDSFTLTLDEM